MKIKYVSISLLSALVFSGMSVNIAVADNLGKYGDVLESFFTERETVFEGLTPDRQIMVTDMFSANTVIQEEAHAAFIENWKRNLGIEVFDSEVFFSTVDILEQTATTTKLAVYEWVDIDYMFPSEGFTRTMGFGTDHIIDIDSSSGYDQIITDSYIEITGFETGDENDLAVLRARLNDEDLAFNIQPEDIHSSEEMSSETTPIRTGYNHSAAVAYSNLWCGYYVYHATDPISPMHPSAYNPEYYYYSGADCCNFVSQCIKAGGKSTSGNWWVTMNTGATVPVADTSNNKSGSAWRYTPDFKNYWTSQGYTIYNFTSTSQAGAGNPMFWLKSDGYSTNHAMLVVAASDTENVVFVNAHNSDCYCYPRRLSDMIFYTLWF